ncbi:MAG: BhlA/UviB family holin-like peptide [Clostridium celatum]|nr:BhlA/UviB family holin-like peptide [Clostridium celatum]MDU4978862.1 BhlA/UviB family holin-like peptide [Clostridium celatum]
METEILKIVVSQGIFAVLFVWLFFDTRKDSKQREEKYINTIDKLTDKISIVEDIKEDVEEIKDKIGI